MATKEKTETIYPKDSIDISILAYGHAEPEEHPSITFQKIARGTPMIINKFSIDSEELRTRHGEFKLVGGTYSWFYNAKEVSLSFLCQKFPGYRDYFISHTKFFIEKTYEDLEILSWSETSESFIREQLDSLEKDLQRTKTELEIHE